MTLAPDLTARNAADAAARSRLERRRNPLLASLCALVTVACALAAYVLTTRAAHRVEVVQVTAAVPAGGQLTRIAPAFVAEDSHLDYVPWTQRGQLTRYRAAAALVPGQLLFGAELTDRPAAPAGDLTVGVVVKAGGYPLALAAGAHIAVLLVPPAGGAAAPGAGAVLVPDATVAQVTTATGTDPTAASAAISLYLPQAQAPAVAQAAAAGQIALALTASGP
jgi:hypothetical protein